MTLTSSNRFPYPCVTLRPQVPPAYVPRACALLSLLKGKSPPGTLFSRSQQNDHFVRGFTGFIRGLLRVSPSTTIGRSVSTPITLPDSV